MAQYDITSPDGQKFRVTAPDDASQEQVMAYAKNNFKMASAPSPINKAYDALDPIEGMGALDKFLAGAGKAVADVGRSAGQGVRWLSPALADAVGAPTQADIDEAQARDKALMNTGAGMAGNIGANIGMAFIPGTGQLGAAKKINDLWKAGGAASRLAALGGAAGMGAAQNVVMNPRSSDDTLGGQLGMGAAMGAGGQLVGPAIAGGIQLGRNIRAGSMGTAGGVLADFARVDPAELSRLIRAGNRELVPGSAPTTVQVTQNQGLATLKNAIRGMNPNGFAGVDAQQNAARLAALNDIAPGASGRKAIDAAENAGDVLAQEAALHRDTLKGLIRDQYNHPSLSTASIALPDQGAATAVLNKFYPGQALAADEAGRSLAAFAKRLDSGEPIPVKEFDALRKIAGNKAADLRDTDRTAAAAWGALKGLFNDAEGQAIAKSGNKFAVTGQGPWGPQFGNLAGDPENAIAHLLRMGQGSVPSAANNQFAGPIELVAGPAGRVGPSPFGLVRVEQQGRDDALRALPDLLQDGSWYSRLQASKNGLQPKDGEKNWSYLGNGDMEAFMRQDFNGASTRPWPHSVYPVNPQNKLPIEGAYSSRGDPFTHSPQTPNATTGAFSLSDIEAAFKAFDQSMQPPVPLRDPRQYVGGLLAPDQAQHLQAGRQMHGELIDRFDTGPANLLWKTGSDGAPRLQGAEAIKAFVNGKDSQAADIAQLRKMVLDRGPTMQAAKGYALSDLIHSATDAQGQLLPSKFVGKNSWTDLRSAMLKGLLDSGERAQLGNVSDDLQRAAAADALERVRGQPNSAEKLKAYGLLNDTPVTDAAISAISRIPYGGGVVAGLLSTGLTASKEAIKHLRLKDVPGTLIDPMRALKALQVQQALMQKTMLQRGLLSEYVQPAFVPALTSGD